MIKNLLFSRIICLVLFGMMVTVVSGQKTTSTQQNTDSLTIKETQKINIGYQTVDKNNVTGNIVIINKEDFNKGFFISVHELIQGKVPGLLISSENGEPGNVYNIQNHGINGSFHPSSPLVVVNDVVLDNSQVYLNPNDIELCTVLKDASATAIYGEKAANGVIIIETKKGGKDLSVNYTVQGSFSVLPKKYDVFSANEFRNLVTEKYSENPNAIALLGNANTNWQDEIYQNAYGQDHNLNFSGSVFNVPLRLSGGYLNQDGIVKTANINRHTFGLALSPEFFNHHLKISLNHNVVNDEIRLANDNVYACAAKFDPTQPVYENNNYGGYYTWNIDGVTNLMATANPVSLLKQTKLYNDINSRITNIKLDYMLHFLPDLHIVFNYGNDYYKQNIKEDVDSTAAWTYSMAKGLYQRTNYTSENKIYDVNLIYSHKIKPLKSSIDFIAGYTYQNTKINYNNYERNTAYPLLVFDSSYASLENKYDAIFGRLIYNLKNKYSLSLSLRNDGFSKLFDGHNGSIFLPVNNLLFNDPNRNVFTPAAAIAWEISKEPFMKNIPFVSDLKLKTEYGKTGAWQQKDSKNLMHEEISTFSIGMDFGFFKNKITGSANYYNQVNDKLFAIITLFGGENYTANFGKIKNTGFELVLNTKIISSKNWKWNVSCNGAYNKNEVKTDNEYDYYGNETGTIVGYYGNKIMIYSSGDPLNTFFVLQQRYIDGKPMEGMYVDRSGEGGNIAGNIDNYYKYKSSNPKIIIGFASDVTYKNWNFSFSARANIGNYVYNNISSNSAYGIIYESNYLQNIDKSVTESGFLYPQFFSDYYVENASFLRMDYIRLNYHFDKIWNHKVALDVFTTVQNAFVITKYKGLDPEVSDGIDYYSCPRARIFSLGCSLHLL